METILSFFKKPHPFNYKGNSSLASGLIIAFLLFALQPFGFGQLDLFPRLWKSLIMGATTTFTLLASYGLCTRILPQTFQNKQWLVWNDLLFSAFNVMLIGIANSLVIYWLKLSASDLPALVVNVVSHTILIGIVASFLLLFIEQSFHLRTELAALQRLNKQLETRKVDSTESSVITFVSEKGKPEFRLDPNEIIYLKSEGNYVEIFYVNDQREQKKELLRNRLKAVEALLPQDRFFQCHRSYFVNTDRISRVNRGGRDYEISMKGSDKSVPVSRTRADQLIQLLKTD
ncbi:MAG: LytTR family transcriptional regulator [Roseivirga sp.]|nr:LytTR family transcriptional regulator [Roseivirga sp.]